MRPLTAAMAAVFGILTVAAFCMGFGNLAWLIAAVELISAAIMLAIRAAIGRFEIPDRFVYPVLVGIAVIALVRCTAQLVVWGSPRDTSNFAIVIGATSLVSLSIGWSALVAALAWSSYLYVFLFIHPTAEWSHFGFFLLWATALAAVVQVVRKRLIWQILQAEARYQALVEHLPMISYVDEARAGGGLVYVSPQIEQILGYSPKEWTSHPQFCVAHMYPPDRERAQAAILARVAAQTPSELEYRLVAKDGRVVWIQDQWTLLAGSSGRRPCAYGIMVDITERKRAEALRTGANRVFEQLAAGASIADMLTVLIRASEEVHPGILGSVRLLDEDNCLRHVAGPSLPDDYIQAADGLPVAPEAGSCGAAAHSGQRVIVEDIATHPHWEKGREAALAAGLSSCWSEPILSSTGGVLGTLAMYYRRPYAPRETDFELIQTAARLAGLAIERARSVAAVTSYREHLEELVAQRTHQLAASRDKLRQSERLASVGTLAAGIAHEINNPVGVILLSAEQALHRLAQPDSTRLEPFLRDIVENAKRCGQIVKTVLRFARQAPGERWAADINVLVRRAVMLTRSYVARHEGTIETTLGEPLPHVLLNPVELEQVLVNLIRNAVESAAAAPRVSIATEATRDTVRVIVSDNGCGVREEDRGRIFDPFFTTRQTKGGTGLGLSLAYGIVSDHGGTIRVESASHEGTVMIVELPALPPAQVEEPTRVSEQKTS